MTAGYQTILEISKKGFTWWFALVGLVPAIPGAFVWWWRRSHKVTWRAIWISYAFPAFALIWICGCSIPMEIGYRKLLYAYRAGEYSMVESKSKTLPLCLLRVTRPNAFVCSQNIFAKAIASSLRASITIPHMAALSADLSVRIAFIGNDILRLEGGQPRRQTSEVNSASALLRTTTRLKRF